MESMLSSFISKYTVLLIKCENPLHYILSTKNNSVYVVFMFEILTNVVNFEQHELWFLAVSLFSLYTIPQLHT